jgi:hypothetical protein
MFLLKANCPISGVKRREAKSPITKIGQYSKYFPYSVFWAKPGRWFRRTFKYEVAEEKSILKKVN